MCAMCSMPLTRKHMRDHLSHCSENIRVVGALVAREPGPEHKAALDAAQTKVRELKTQVEVCKEQCARLQQHCNRRSEELARIKAEALAHEAAVSDLQSRINEARTDLQSRIDVTRADLQSRIDALARDRDALRTRCDALQCAVQERDMAMRQAVAALTAFHAAHVLSPTPSHAPPPLSPPPPPPPSACTTTTDTGTDTETPAPTRQSRAPARASEPTASPTLSGAKRPHSDVPYSTTSVKTEAHTHTHANPDANLDPYANTSKRARGSV